METSFALTGKGYIIMAADTTAARSIVKMKVDEDKIKTLSSHLIMAYSGEPGKHDPPPGFSFPFFHLKRADLEYIYRRYCSIC